MPMTSWLFVPTSSAAVRSSRSVVARPLAQTKTPNTSAIRTKEIVDSLVPMPSLERERVMRFIPYIHSQTSVQQDHSLWKHDKRIRGGRAPVCKDDEIMQNSHLYASARHARDMP